MEQDLKVAGIQSLQTTDETSRTKRPYNKIPSEIRSQILHALTVEKLPLQDVASKFQTKPCTCKAILLTYELEGRSEKKTSRRERIEIESKIRVVIVDPYGRNHGTYENTKFSKIYSEGKELTNSEETNIQKKLILEVSQQLGELQSSCYHLQPQQTHQQATYNDEHAPENVLRGINMSLHLVTSKIREGQLILNKKINKQIKVGSKMDQELSSQQLFDQETLSQTNFNQIQQFMKSVLTKSETNPNLFDQLKQLTSQTILQMQILQKLQKRDSEIKNLQYQVNQIIRKCFECPS